MAEYVGDFIVVIRSAGERTVKACEKLIREEIDDKAECITIECSPFEEAIKKSYKIGIESGKKWLVTVDADVLIRKGGITDLLKMGETLSKEVFQYEGFLYDGLLLKYRQGGVKVYRANLLPKALSKVPEPGTEIRPETYTQDEMAKVGYIRKKVEYVTGVHDYEQYYKDVYRKCHVHAVKFQKYVFKLLPKWNELSKADKTYKVAAIGAFEGLKLDGKIFLDVNHFEKKSIDALNFYGISERKKLNHNEISDTYVTKILDNAGEFKLLNRRQRILKVYKTNSLFKTLRWGLSKLLSYAERKVFPDNIIIEKS